MTSQFIFFLTVLAVFRLSYMFSKETGPGAIFKRLRQQFRPDTFMRDLLDCPYCQSVWWAFVFVCLLGSKFPEGFITYWLAISAGSMLTNKLFTWSDK